MCKRVFANQTSEIGEVPFYKIGTIGAEADAFISQELYEEYRSKYNYPRHGEVLITCAGTVGKTITYKGEDAYYQDSNIVWISNPKQYYVNSFLQRVLSRIDWSKLNTTTIVRIYNDNLRDIVVFYPSKKEQDKITNLFSLIDDRIQTQIGAIEDYKRLKGYLIDKLIKQQDCTMKIGDVIAQKSERNRKGDDYTVLSVSNQKGFLAQSEQFEEREVASEDKSSYKIVRRDDFAYNPARINVGSIARLINYDCGIVSPMYICFHADKCVLPEFLGYFFESRCFATEVDKRLEGSVRLCLSYDGLCDIPIQIPDVEKQRAIIQKLDAVSQKIVLEEQCLDLFKQQKDYLLKNMFV